jgi:hypothetical protein
MIRPSCTSGEVLYHSTKNSSDFREVSVGDLLGLAGIVSRAGVFESQQVFQIAMRKAIPEANELDLSGCK